MLRFKVAFLIEMEKILTLLAFVVLIPFRFLREVMSPLIAAMEWLAVLVVMVLVIPMAVVRAMEVMARRLQHSLHQHKTTYRSRK